MIIDLKISFDLRRLLMSGAIFISDDLVHLCENCPETLCGCISQFLKSTLRELVYGRPAHLSMKTTEGIFYNEQKYIVNGNPIQIALSLFIVIQLKTYQKNITTLV